VIHLKMSLMNYKLIELIDHSTVKIHLDFDFHDDC